MDENSSMQNGTSAPQGTQPWPAAGPVPEWTPAQALTAPAEAAPGRPFRRHRTRFAVVGTLSALGMGTAAVVGIGTSGAATTATSPGVSAQSAPTVTLHRGGFGTGLPAGGAFGGSAGSGASGTTATATATADQQIGIVDIDTVLAYRGAEAAGTGMVLTSNGEILTNNHVIEGATGITVTIVSTGATYTATVVGTDPTDDVAVLQLDGASALQVADVSTGAAQLGDAVTAVGNAGGTGGTPSAASGSVTALDRSITATDETGAHAEQLTGLIETDADVQAGDSGGPLYDTASGEIIGMDTAASSGTAVDGYAIPISTALSIAQQITDGVDSATVHQGYPGFLGVSVSPSASGSGAAIAGVLSGGPAGQAGLAAGDVVTAVDGTPVASGTDLTTALAGHAPGDTVSLTWTDATGSSRSAHVTLIAGPAD